VMAGIFDVGVATMLVGDRGIDLAEPHHNK
jgi:hypothetical protein